MRGLKPMHRVGRAQLARLHHESEQPRGQTQEKKWITQPSSETRSHRLEVIVSGVIRQDRSMRGTCSLYWYNVR